MRAAPNEAWVRSWRFERVRDAHTRVTFRYSFETRWRRPRPLLERGAEGSELLAALRAGRVEGATLS